jgi:glycine dehydrogenase subunit 1
MHFLPNATLQSEMLEAIGASSIADLFADIPANVRLQKWDLPPGKGELDVITYLRQALSKNVPTTDAPSFVGGTLKEH